MQLRAISRAKYTFTVFSFILPGLILYLLFMLLPILDTINISFTDWNGMRPNFEYVGFQNYADVLTHNLFWNAMRNTLFWVVAQLAIIIFPTLVLSLAISRVRWGKTFFRAVFYIPAVISFAVAAIIWRRIYDPMFGPINALLNSVGLEALALNWLGNPATVLPALVVASSWVQYGLYMVLYLAGLQGIDHQLYEAADIDGANQFVKFTRITIPALRNTINVITSLVIINAFRGFSMVWITTQGGPFYTSDLVATYIYRVAFQHFQTGRGTAAGVLLTLIIIIVTVVFNVLRDRSDRR